MSYTPLIWLDWCSIGDKSSPKINLPRSLNGGRKYERVDTIRTSRIDSPSLVKTIHVTRSRVAEEHNTHLIVKLG